MAARIPIWAKLGLSILSPIVAFSLCEGLFFLAGVQPLSLTQDPYVGFASMQPLFLESKGEAGEKRMVTNPTKLTHFNQQSFALEKPPGTFRIFSLGGSTAYGHPWRDPVSFSGWLRELLPKADSGRKWEVINAGGISYASYREAMLIAELIRYKPDLFLVYSGHNEFLEERTYRATTEIPVIVREASAMLDHTRTYSVLKRLMGKSAPGGSDAPASGAAGSNFNMASEVDDVLAKTIGPTSYTRDDSLRMHVLEHYGASLARMAKLAHSVGAEVIFLTTPGNEKDCSPFKSEPKPGLTAGESGRIAAWKAQADSLDSLISRPDASLSARALPMRAALYDSIVSLDSRNAGLLYTAGQAAYAAGGFARAKTLFQHALDEDICPLRAVTPMRPIVLEAARANSAQALDWSGVLERKTDRRLGNNVLGEPDFVDHVHLTIEDYRLLALAIIGKMSALGMVKTSRGWDENAADDPVVKEVAARVMAGMGPHELGEGLHNLAKVVNWAGKHEDAARIAERALATDSLGLEAIWSSLFVGAARERQGKEAEAIPHYRRAVRLDTTNPLAHQYLADALLRKGENAEAAREFASVLRYDPADGETAGKLGMLLVAIGKPVEAVPALRQAVNQFPNRDDFRIALDEALLRSGNSDAAESNFRRDLQRDPRDARAMIGLAKVAQAKGDIAEAINLYAQALSIDPNLPEARAALGKLLGAMPSR
ncbi:MAG: tetratricopeptide repeat protein [Fibrobacteria bacterium]